MVRIAAAGDIQASEATRGRLACAFREVEESADVVLLAGDLTITGEPDQAEVLADVCRDVSIPVFAVLGDHDTHAGRAREVSARIGRGGVHVLERAYATFQIGDTSLGVVGAKGFLGGFGRSILPDFGEPLLRRVYAETTLDVEAVSRGLGAIALCDLRIVLLHYAPVEDTIQGEPEGSHVMLGSERLARPIAEHGADLVVHGHAQDGSFEGRIGETPVYNVAVHVIGRDFWVFDLDAQRAQSTVAVEEV